MTTFDRRDFLKALGIGGAAALGAAFVPGFAAPAAAQGGSSGTLGTVLRVARGPVTLHSYIAPEASFLVTTQIIETPNSLVVVDTQLAQTFASDARAYIDSLGKPIERVILSHEHPDHWAGATNYTDVPFFATEATIANVNAAIEGGSLEELAGLLGPEAPESANPPTEIISGANETIDGVAFEYSTFQDHESAEALVIRLPEAGALIVQDLLYSNSHFFPGQNRDNWLSILDGLRTDAGADLLLVGHGYPTGLGELDQGIAYLNFVQATIPTVANADELVAALQAEFPSYGVVGLLSFWEQFFPAS